MRRPPEFSGTSPMVGALNALSDYIHSVRILPGSYVDHTGDGINIRGGGMGGAGATPYPFYPKAAVAEDPANPPADLALRLTIGKGLVRGQTDWTANSNAGDEFTLSAGTDYIFWLEAEINTDRELTALIVDYGTTVPTSPAGNATTGEPPTVSFHPFMTITTGAEAIDWSTLVHDQSNYIVAVVPQVVVCDENTLIGIWFRS